LNDITTFNRTPTRKHNALAKIVVQVLDGAKPGDLPMEQPTKLEFIVNLKVARSIGVSIPHSALLRRTRIVSALHEFWHRASYLHGRFHQ
jgi:hypothetical protein